MTGQKLHELQTARRDFIDRSKARELKKRMIREVFQTHGMRTSVFNHMCSLIDAEQRRDERHTGFKYSDEYSPLRRPGRVTDDRLSV